MPVLYGVKPAMTENSLDKNIDKLFGEVYSEIRLGNYENALTLLLREDRHLRCPFKSANANHAWYVVGDTYFKLGKFSYAINAFKNSLRACRDDVEALWAIGNAYSEIGRPRLAERYFRKALYLDKTNSDELSFNLGNALFDQKKYAEAISIYLKVKRKNKAIWKKSLKNIKLSRSMSAPAVNCSEISNDKCSIDPNNKPDT